MLIFAVLLVYLAFVAMAVVGAIVMIMASVGYAKFEGRRGWRAICLTLIILGAVLMATGSSLLIDPAGFGGIMPREPAGYPSDPVEPG